MQVRFRVLALLAAALMVGCGSSGGGDQRSVEILQGEAAVEAGVQAAVSLATLVGALVGEVGPQVRGQAAQMSAVGSSAIARAVRASCPFGGTTDGECRESGGRTFVRSSFSDCRMSDVDNRFELRFNGRADITFEGVGICASPSLALDRVSRIELRDYREEWHAPTGVFRVIEAPRLTREYRPVAGGCSSENGDHIFDGRIVLSAQQFVWALRMRGTRIAVRSSGVPCDQVAEITGEIDVDDRLRGSRFVVDADGLRVAQTGTFDGEMAIALDGPASIDCVGDVRYATDSRLRIARACPHAGSLSMQVNGATARAGFTTAGIEIDTDGDGEVDLETGGCGAEAMAACM